MTEIGNPDTPSQGYYYDVSICNRRWTPYRGRIVCTQFPAYSVCSRDTYNLAAHQKSSQAVQENLLSFTQHCILSEAKFALPLVFHCVCSGKVNGQPAEGLPSCAPGDTFFSRFPKSQLLRIKSEQETVNSTLKGLSLQAFLGLLFDIWRSSRFQKDIVCRLENG